MRYSIFAAISVSGFLLGCLQEPSVAPNPVDPDKNQLTTAMSVTNGTAYFDFHSERQSNDGASVERYLDCIDGEVLTAFGARVSNGNITGLRIHCRPINPDGTLGAIRMTLSGSSAIEREIFATDGWVVADVGGKVDGSAFTRAYIKECKWVPETRTVDISTCRERSTDGNLSVELKFGAHIVAYFPQLTPICVMTGVGLTAGNEALSVIRISIGVLKAVINASGLTGGTNSFKLITSGDERFTVISIAGGTGDADLYVGKGYVPTRDHYDCRPFTSGNNESCTMERAPGETGRTTYNVLVDAWAPYSGVTVKGEYFH